jgi:DHA1 family tetracycline resistance protein-like MFS transporter
MAILLFIVFLDLLGFGVMIPLLPFYGKHFGASPTAITWMMAAYSLAQFFSSPILGRLSDKVGRRPVLLVSLACSVTAYLWLGLADAFWMLVAARLLAGAGAGNIAAAQAYITDVTEPEKRAKGMGLIGAAFGVGFTFGPPIGGMIAGRGDTLAALARPAFVSAGLSAIAFVLVLVWLKESLPDEARYAPPRPSRWQVARHISHRPSLRLLILLLFTTVVAFAAMETTQALWLNDAFGWDQWDVGLLFLFVGVVLIIIQGFLIGPLSRRFGGPRLVTFGAGAIMVGLGGMPFAALRLPVLLFMCGSLAVGMGLLNPSINALISREAGADERGGILGVAQSGASLARIIGPVVAGPLFTLLGRDAPYYAGGLVMLIALAMALRIPRGTTVRAVVQPAEPAS